MDLYFSDAKRLIKRYIAQHDLSMEQIIAIYKIVIGPAEYIPENEAEYDSLPKVRVNTEHLAEELLKLI